MKKIILSLIVFTAALFISLKFINVKAATVAPELIEGAQIRTDNNAGMKFVANATPVNGATYGMVIARGDVNNLTVETPDTIKGETTTLNDNNQFYITIVNFPEYAYTQNLTVRAYICVDGVYTYSENNVVRNISEVAIGAAAKGEAGDFISKVTKYTKENYMKVYTDELGNIHLDDAVYESRPAALAQVFTADWNKLFGTSLDATNAFLGGTQSPFYLSARSKVVNDWSTSNLKTFFQNAEMYAKWGWLFDYINVELSDGIGHEFALAQIEAIVNNTENADNWYYGGHLSSFILSILTGSKQSSGWGNFDFDTHKDVLSLITNYNDTIYSADQTFVKVGENLSLTAFNKEGYTFSGYTDGEVVYENNYPVTNKPTFLTPSYCVEIYNINFYNGSTQLNDLTMHYNIENYVELPELEIDGYKFLGWYENSSLTGDPIYTLNPGTIGDKTLYAKLEEKRNADVNVTLDANPGNFGFAYAENVQTLHIYNNAYSNTAVENYLCDTSVPTNNSLRWQYKALLQYDSTLNAYKVVCLDAAKASANDAATAAGVTWTHAIANKQVNITTMFTLGQYVIFEKTPVSGDTNIKYIVTNDPANPYPTTLEMVLSDPTELIVPLKANDTFLGWKSSLDGSIVTSFPGYEENPGDITYTAQWESMIKVEYDLDGGEFLYDSIDEAIADFLNDYNTAKGKSHTVETFFALGSMEEISHASTFLYAEPYKTKWTWLVNYIATVAGKNNKAAFENYYNFTSQAEFNAANTNYIYCFAYELRGWVGKAQYTKNANFHTADYSLATIQNDLETIIKTPVKEGCEFIGWKSSIDGSIITTFPGYETTQAVTYTAQWIKDNYVEVSLNTADKNVIENVSPTIFVNSSFVADKTYIINGNEYSYGETAFASIADAVAAAPANSKIYVFAGTYSNAFTVSVSGVSIYGPNANISYAQTRNAEAIISGKISVAANNFTLNGIKFTGSQIKATTAVSNLSILNIISTSAGAVVKADSTGRHAVIGSESALTGLNVKNSSFTLSGAEGKNIFAFYGSTSGTDIQFNSFNNGKASASLNEIIRIEVITGKHVFANNICDWSTINWAIQVGYTSNSASQLDINDNIFRGGSTTNYISGCGIYNFPANSVVNYVGNKVYYMGGNAFCFDGSVASAQLNIEYNYFDANTSFQFLTQGSGQIYYNCNYYAKSQTTSTSDYGLITSLDELESAYANRLGLAEVSVTFNTDGGVFSKNNIVGSSVKSIPVATFSNICPADKIYVGTTAITEYSSLRYVRKIVLNYIASVDLYLVVAVDDATTAVNSLGVTWTHVIAHNTSSMASYAKVGQYIAFPSSVASGMSACNALVYDAASVQGGTTTLKAKTVLPTPAKTGYEFLGWKSSLDGSIVTTYPGYITNPGNITYTAQWGFDGHIVGEFKEESYVSKGNSIQLAATFVGGASRKLNWKSNNPSIATVDQYGVVTGVGDGVAEIVVTDAEYANVSFTFYVTSFSSAPTGIVKLLAESNNTEVFTSFDLGIGAGTPAYYYDAIGSVSKLLFENYVVHKDYYLSSPSNKTTLTGSGKGGVDFITVHYAADMPYSATYSKKGGSNLASMNKTYNNNGTGASWNYGVGNDGVWYCQNTAYGSWHAGSSKTMTWTSTGLTTAQLGTEVYTTDVKLGSDGYFYIKGIKTSVKNTTGYTKLNSMGLGVKLSGSTWYLGGHYYNSSYKYISSKGGNNNSIGMETSVREGSDLWLTWQYTAQLCANLLNQFELPLNRLVGHHFFSGKDCPQPLLANNLEIWYEFVELVRQQMEFFSSYSSYTLTASSNSSYVKSNGRVTGLPKYTECITYTVTYKTGSTSKTVTLSTMLPGTVA